MKHLNNLVGVCLSSNGISSSPPVSGGPQALPSLAAPGAGLPQMLRLQPAYGRYGSHRITKNAQMESVLYSFAGGSDGADPVSELTNVGGTLYGTTSTGGESSGAAGTVFSLSL